MHSSSLNGFCSKSIQLDSSGVFFMEHGCEGNSQVAYGRYKLLPNNLINFKRLPFDSIAPISKIDRFHNELDTTLTVTFLDREGMVLAYVFIGQVGNDKGIITEPFTNEKGQLVLDRKHKHQIFISAIDRIYGKDNEITADGESSIDVYFNLPSKFLIYPEVRADDFEEFELVLLEDGLYEKDRKTLVYKKPEQK